MTYGLPHNRNLTFIITELDSTPTFRVMTHFKFRKHHVFLPELPASCRTLEWFRGPPLAKETPIDMGNSPCSSSVFGHRIYHNR